MQRQQVTCLVITSCLAAVALTFGCSAVSSAPAMIRPAPVPADVPPSETVQLHVPGNAVWPDSGVNLDSGDLVLLEAEGTWSGSVLYGYCGPDGYTDHVVNRSWWARVPEILHSALIGRIGGTEPFLVGSRTSFEVLQSGTLRMMCNQIRVSDNRGQLDVTATIWRNKRSTEEDENGESTPPPPPTKPSRPIANRWAVVVGISEYAHADGETLASLAFADKDARDFAYTLGRAGWPDSQIKVLTNRSAKRLEVGKLICDWLSKARPDDLIVLYWSGHGFPDPEDSERAYLACYDTNPRAPSTGYRMDRLIDDIKDHGARNVVVLADTCHAGKLFTRGDSRAVGVERYLRRMDVPKGWIFMGAAASDRQAIEHTSWSNGAFTHCLLRGLAGEADGALGGRDDVVTMGELRNYLYKTMPDETHRVLGKAKHPKIECSTTDSRIWELSLERD